ncbi:MAG TPA: hypothetical protein PKD86_17570, partial [Gemmatales bacterium]|nr:hypothetical protein [Gemmatales bacterium]
MNSKRLNLFIGFGICLYAVTVLAYAHQASDIGITCAFGTQVRAVQLDSVPWELAPQGRPRVGDTVVRVGGYGVDSWSSFLRAVYRVGESAGTDLPRGAEALAELERMAASGQAIVRVDARDLVRVEFDPANGGSRRFCWCVVGTPPVAEFIPSLAWLFVKLGLFAVGALVYWRRPHDRSAHRFFWLCVCTVGAFMGGYHWLRIASSPALSVVFMICAMMLPSVSLHFYLVFPRPKPILERHPGWTLGLVYGVPAVMLAVMLGTLAGLIASFRLGYDPTVVSAWSTALVREVFTALPVAALLFLGCLVSLVHSLVVSPPGSQTRNQVKWILGGAVAAAIPICYTLFIAVVRPDEFGLGGATWPMFAASLAITVGYGISISRYGLMSVSDVLNLQILSMGISVGAGVIFTALVFLGMVGLDQFTAGPSPFWQSAWVTAVALVMLGITYFARNRLRQVLHRRFHKTKFQLDETMRRMTQAVEQRIDPVQLCRRYLVGLSELIGFEQGALYMRGATPGVFRLTAHLGVEPAVADLAYGAPLVDALDKAPFIR